MDVKRKMMNRYKARLALLGLGVLLSGCAGMQNSVSDGTCTVAPTKATSKPYKIKGVWYYPQQHFEYEEVGIASFYGGGDVFHGRPTATGERFDMNGVTAAHKTLPLPCIVEVENMENGRTLQVKVNDRGPFIDGRIIDLSRRSAQLLGFEQKGTVKVRVRTLVPESLALNNMPAGGKSAPVMDPSIMEDKPVLLAESSDEIGMFVNIPETAPLEYGTPTAMDLTPINDGEYVKAIQPVMANAVPKLPAGAASGAASAATNSGIYVDVGEFATANAGQATMQTVSAHNKAAAIAQIAPDKYSVRIGPLSSMADADQLVDILETQGQFVPKIVMSY